MPRVSVIVPVFNAERYLAQALESVVSQTFNDLEIVCVNDGSTDGSARILAEYAARDARMLVIEQPNGGLSSARNRGLESVRGDYVAFLDSDDYYEPTMIEKLYARCAEADADVGIAKIRYIYTESGRAIDANWSLRMDMVPETRPFNRADMEGRLFRFITPAVWSKMFRRAFLLDHGLRFVENLKRAEDVAFTYTALVLADKIVVVDEPLVNYRKGVPEGLQATIHEEPFVICDALDHVKLNALEAGVFDEIERDFVNAALDQCLFTLRSLRTLVAFTAFYESLNDRYFAHLGIAGREADYFFDEGLFEQYRRVTELTWQEYLFAETVKLGRQRDEAGHQIGDLRAALDDTRRQLREAVEGSGAAREAKAARRELAKVNGQLERVLQSRSYRLARSITAPARWGRRSSPPVREGE